MEVIEPIIFVLQIFATVLVGVVELVGFCLKAGGDSGKGGGVTAPRVERKR